ncbi:glycerophosphodiester phosphodiesterase [candidate division KSB1 bacterium]|nr:MAG: glycerophosphodiester phosphodiesterase [candidate division KSB1 bacterium]
MKTFESHYLAIGHRGASGYAPENTMAAFRKAHELGADGVELDVQLSKDDRVVIMHDDRINRTTNGSGYVKDKTLKELVEYDAGGWFSDEYRNERIPTLEELFDYATGRMLVDVELKKSKNPEALVRAVKKLADAFQNYQDCLFTSFDVATVNAVLRIMPKARCGLLIDTYSHAVWEGAWPFVAAKTRLIKNDLFQASQEHNKFLIAWTANDEEEMKRLRHVGVGRIITNYPDMAKKVHQEIKKS